MNTEQLKAVALKATPGPWFAMPTCEVSQWVDVVAHDEVGRYSLPFVSCKHFDSEANAQHIAAANPATILALLECVDALRLQRECIEDNLAVLSGNRKFAPVEAAKKSGSADAAVIAALQKLEAL